MDRWDILCIVVAAYVSVVTLVRLMANRRNELVAKIREEIAKQRAATRTKSSAAQQQQDQDAA